MLDKYIIRFIVSFKVPFVSCQLHLFLCFAEHLVSRPEPVRLLVRSHKRSPVLHTRGNERVRETESVSDDRNQRSHTKWGRPMTWIHLVGQTTLSVSHSSLSTIKDVFLDPFARGDDAIAESKKKSSR